MFLTRREAILGTEITLREMTRLGLVLHTKKIKKIQKLNRCLSHREQSFNHG